MKREKPCACVLKKWINQNYYGDAETAIYEIANAYGIAVHTYDGPALDAYVTEQRGTPLTSTEWDNVAVHMRRYDDFAAVQIDFTSQLLTYAGITLPTPENHA